MAIKIPDGVGAVSLGVVGDARVLLRSDRVVHCVECDRTVRPDLPTQDEGWCEHLQQVLRLGVLRSLRDEEGRFYPEWVWHRTSHKTVARWPPIDDPDNAVGTLVLTLRDALHLRPREDAKVADPAEALAEAVLANLRHRGYCVVPEWVADGGTRRQPRPRPSGRGARLFDLADEGVAP